MIRASTLRNSAGHHAAHCMLEITGVHVAREVGGCVLAHIPFAGNFGMGLKTDDVCATFACGPCHDRFDGRTKGLVKGSEDWLYYALRGQTRTLLWWIEHGYINVKGMK